MPRKSRIDAPGALHHIIARGIDRSKIFQDPADKRNFLNRLAEILKATETSCYAWALIPNHFHLLLRTGSTPVVTVMRRLLTGHALWYNRRHRRHGYLFQNRYKSFLCQEDTYFLELVRCIHLNPLRAGPAPKLPSLDKYSFSGHSVLMIRNSKIVPSIPFHIVECNFTERLKNIPTNTTKNRPGLWSSYCHLNSIGH
jgi:putative transposase